MLTLKSVTPRKFPILTLIVMLGAAVFFWQFSYRLSLYQPVTAQSSAPAVKLLSQKERLPSIVKLGSLFGTGKSLREAPRQPLSHTNLPWLAVAHSAVLHGATALPGAVCLSAQQPSLMIGGSPRAPPACA